MEAAESGLGVVIVNRKLAEPNLDGGRLVIPFDLDIPGEGGYYLVYPRERAEEPNIAAFREWILEAIAAEQEVSG